MVYTCSICHVEVETISGLCTHIRFIHPINILSSYQCCHCRKEYSSIQYLRDHLKKKHPDGNIRENMPENLEDNLVDDEMQVENENDILIDENIVEEVHINEHPITVLDFKKALYESSLALSAKLYSSTTLNRSQVQEILNLCSDYASSGFLDVLKAKTMSLLREVNGHDQSIQELNEMFSSMQDCFSGLKTEKQRISALEGSESFIRPQSFAMGVKEVIRYVEGEPVLTPVELTGQFLSMSRVLKKFFELPGVLNATLSNIQTLQNSELFSNIVQSPLWRNIEETQFQNRLVLPLIVYFDDAEPDNQTGSHSGAHSLGMVYYQVPCIPQHLLSSLDNIFLASVFLSDDRVRNTIAAFRPIINDLKFLETEGIRVEVEDQVHYIFFGLSLLIGDNKGIHSMTGYVESFSANYCCRICKEHKAVMRVQLRENPTMLRNPVNYAADLLLDDYSRTGIKSECTWNVLNSYHVAVNIALEIMHDLLEGVCHYDLCAVLLELLRLEFFTLQTLNERVQHFDYGLDSGDKPSLITVDHLRNQKLKMSASEMLCFVRNLGLMIGDLVPEENEQWMLYVLLTEIVDIVTAPYVRTEVAPYLATLISEHHGVYQNVFNKTLKPKYHLMLHYPRVMNQIGPLIHIWCMRMEGMHRPVVKRSARSHTCRKNLPLSTALRYCLSLSARFIALRGFPDDVKFHLEETNIRDVDGFERFQNVLPAGYEDCVVVKQVTIRGTLYNRNMVLIFNYEDDLPLFGLIRCIAKPLGEGDEKAWFLLSGLRTVGLNQHLHSHEVRPYTAEKWFFIQYDELVSFYPSKCRIGANGLSYVTFRHQL